MEHEGGEGAAEAQDSASSDDDYEKPFQDYKLICKMRKLVYNFGLNKRVDAHKPPPETDKYHVQAVHQILRTDTKLKSRREEKKNMENQIKEKMVMGVQMDYLKAKKKEEESTTADEE